MNPLPELSDKKIIMSHIQQFMNQFRPGDQLRTEDIIKYVHRYHRRYIYGDTILRYLRSLRADGVLSYSCVCKRERIIKVIAPGIPHSA